MMFVEVAIVNVVGGYTENDWTNPRTGERKQIKSFGLVLQVGNNTFVAEASDEMAEKMRSMDLKPDTQVLVSLSFQATRAEKDGVVRYYQRVRLEKVVVL